MSKTLSKAASKIVLLSLVTNVSMFVIIRLVEDLCIEVERRTICYVL